MGNIIQEVDILSVLNQIGRKSKIYQVRTLNGIEQIIDKNSPEYKEIRKIILDEMNDYTRALVRQIFGDVEYLIK